MLIFIWKTFVWLVLPFFMFGSLRLLEKIVKLLEEQNKIASNRSNYSENRNP